MPDTLTKRCKIRGLARAVSSVSGNARLSAPVVAAANSVRSSPVRGSLSMAHGLEARVPFSDTEVLNLAATIPAELALRDGVEKAMLREASRGALPEAVRLRRKSALPKDQGNGESLRQHTREILATDADRIAGLLDVPRLQRRCADPSPQNEHERAVMFRACSLAHRSRVYGVSMP